MNDFVAIFQTIATIAAVAAVFVHLGHRDEQLNSLARSVDRLREAVDDLVKTTVAVTTTLTHSQRHADDIDRRIDRLEHNHRMRSMGPCANERAGAESGVEI